MEARPSKEKTGETVDENGKKTMMKEMNKSLPFPVEVLVKIFNFLPDRDIRCGVSLACKIFYEICQDESLVPVKDLCIYGHPVGRKSKKKGQKGKQNYCLSGAVTDIIRQSKNLTFLKIKALNSENVEDLVAFALQACPKLKHLEIIETNKQLSEYF